MVYNSPKHANSQHPLLNLFKSDQGLLTLCLQHSLCKPTRQGGQLDESRHQRSCTLTLAALERVELLTPNESSKKTNTRNDKGDDKQRVREPAHDRRIIQDRESATCALSAQPTSSARTQARPNTRARSVRNSDSHRAHVEPGTGHVGKSRGGGWCRVWSGRLADCLTCWAFEPGELRLVRGGGAGRSESGLIGLGVRLVQGANKRSLTGQRLKWTR